MANKIKTDLSRMGQDVGSIGSYLQRLDKDYQNLVERKAVLDKMWDGSANEAFNRVFNDDLVALMTMLANLKKLYNYQEMAKNCYATCENLVEGLVADIE